MATKESSKLQQKNNEQNEIEYVEVLGDTVYGKHMITTIFVSGILGLGSFLIGQNIFPKIAPEEMINSYSLLLGIGGLVLSLIINALIFKPKRKLIKEESTVDKINEIFEDYGLNIEEEREAIKNDPVIMKEMKEQGIYNMFFSNEEARK